MTSKISFTKLTLDETRKLGWLTAAQLLVFLMLLPLRMLIVMASCRNSASMAGDPAVITKTFCLNTGAGHLENTVFILIAGVFCALIVFSYLHSARQLDFYHSLAIRRNRLFAVKYLSGALTFVTAYLISQLLTMLVGAFYRAMPLRAVPEIALASVQGILQFLCSYSWTLLAVMLTGKILTSVFAAGVLGFYLPMLLLLDVSMVQSFRPTALSTYYFFDETGFQILGNSSPWAFCITQSEWSSAKGVTGLLPNAGGLCQLLAIAVILTLICAALCHFRRTEAAGHALAFSCTESIVKLLLAIPTTLFAATLAYELFHALPAELAFLLLFGVLSCAVMEFIYRWDIRQALSHKRHILITVAVAGALFLYFRFDLPGYNTRLPAREEIASMALRDTWLGNHVDELPGLRGKDRKALDMLETENFEPIYELAQNGIANIGLDHYASGEHYYVQIKYHTKSGKEIYRSYTVNREPFFQAMDELMQDPAFLKNYFPIMNWDAALLKNLDGNVNLFQPEILTPYLEDAAEADAGNAGTDSTDADDATIAYEYKMDANAVAYDSAAPYEASETHLLYSTDFTIPASWIPRVVEAYREDLAEAKAEDLTDSCGYLYFQNQAPSGETGPETSYLSNYYEANYEIGKGFDRTLSLLAQIWLLQQ